MRLAATLRPRPLAHPQRQWATLGLAAQPRPGVRPGLVQQRAHPHRLEAAAARPRHAAAGRAQAASHLEVALLGQVFHLEAEVLRPVQLWGGAFRPAALQVVVLATALPGLSLAARAVHRAVPVRS